MTNILKARMPNGEVKEIEYNSFADLITFCNSNGLSNPNSERNKAVIIEISSDTPKSRKKEIETALKPFGLKFEEVEELDWIAGGVGGKVDQTSEEQLLKHGVDIKNPQHVEAHNRVIAEMERVNELWKKLRDNNIVSVEGRFYIKSIDKYKKSKK